MIRYVKQRDETSCGPVAIINIFKWMGCKVSYDFIQVTRDLCEHEPGQYGGTTNLNQERALRLVGIKKKRRIKPSIKEIDSHLDSGGIVLLGYHVPYAVPGYKRNEGHFALCIGRTQRSYTMVNDGTKYTVGKRSRPVMKRILQGGAGPERCWAWLISRANRLK